MALTFSNLGNKKRGKKRVGRGNASGHGTYSSRGLKGQRSRSGGKGGLKLKGFKQNLLNLPKFKGMKSLRPNNQVVKLSDLLKAYSDETQVNPATLFEKGLISKVSNPVKILLDNKDIKVTSKLEIAGVLMSKSAKDVLEKAGAKVIDLEAETKA